MAKKKPVKKTKKAKTKSKATKFEGSIKDWFIQTFQANIKAKLDDETIAKMANKAIGSKSAKTYEARDVKRRRAKYNRVEDGPVVPEFVDGEALAAWGERRESEVFNKSRKAKAKPKAKAKKKKKVSKKK